MSYEAVHPMTKKQLCENIYNKHILGAYNILLKYEEYGSVFNIMLPDSCYTNFRDALFHFRKILYSLEEKEMECQAFAVKEHTSRIITDASISYMNLLFDLSRELINDDTIEDSVRMEIRKLMHKLKRFNLFKRLNGMMISDENSFYVSADEILEQIDKFYEYLNSNCKEQFIKHMKIIAS